MITDEIITECAVAEVNNKVWGITQQFFEIHELQYEEEQPVLSRIDREKADGTAIVYFPVKEEEFYLAINVSTQPVVAVTGVWVESNNRVFLQCSSSEMSSEQLAAMTSLVPTETRNRDEKSKQNIMNKHSFIRFEPNPEPDELEDKLLKLLDLLEQDKKGIKELAKCTNATIRLLIVFHYGNSILGGPQLSAAILQRIGALNISLDLDLHAEGKNWL